MLNSIIGKKTVYIVTGYTDMRKGIDGLAEIVQGKLSLDPYSKAYALSDEATVNEVIDSLAFSDFCGVESSDQVPDGDTLGRFRNLLVKNDLQEKLFKQVVELLTKRGLILRKGTIVDSTIISAPSSTKNASRQRDSEAHQTKKGNM